MLHLKGNSPKICRSGQGGNFCFLPAGCRCRGYRCDGGIVGSWLKEGHDVHGEVCEEYVRQFVPAAKK